MDLDELLKPIVGQRARYGLTVHRGIVTISLKAGGVGAKFGNEEEDKPDSDEEAVQTQNVPET